MTRVAAVGGDDHGVVPRQPCAGERQGDAGHPRQHLDLVGGHSLAQQPKDSEEAGVAGGEDDDGALDLEHLAQGLSRVVAQRDDGGACRERDLAQVPPTSHDQGRPGEPLLRNRAQWGAVEPDHGDHAAATQAGSVAATTRAPCGSTIATFAGSPQKRVSTEATRPQSRSPASRNSPAASHSS